MSKNLLISVKYAKKIKKLLSKIILPHLKMTGIFDRIGIDLVLGLPETVDGYLGVLVIVEYLTKYGWAFPIKSKQANEIAELLWNFFCAYGPAKEIISDQGPEFVNEIGDSMINSIGSCHTVTSQQDTSVE